jgi:hypothetical protein
MGEPAEHGGSADEKHTQLKNKPEVLKAQFNSYTWIE